MSLPDPIKSKVSLTLELPASCLQFCPINPDYFVVGTYNLERDATASGNDSVKTPQSRNGSLIVFKTDGEALTHIQTITQPSAILDLRFHPNTEQTTLEKGILAVVSSTGTLAIFRLDPGLDSKSPLQHISTSRCDDLEEDILFLQCNWHPTMSKVLGVTTSNSLARVLYLDQDWKIEKTTDLDIHNSLEAWCISFAPPRGSGGDGEIGSVYCGGDDAMLRYSSWKWADDDGGADAEQAMFSPVCIKGAHNAGVTAILPLSIFDENGGRVVVTGSYDDHVRVFAIHDLQDTYGLKRVQLLAEMDLGGGVWRLDVVHIEPSGQDDSVKVRILASCMHAGARLIEMRRSAGQPWAFDVLARFEEHKSMNYASDFRRQRNAWQEELQCVSTSFYDKLLCLWQYDIE